MKAPEKKFTKRELFALFTGLRVLGNLKGVRFAYAVAKNTNIIKPEIEALQEALKGSDEFLEFEKQRVELAKKHAKKDENGKPLSEGGSFVMENEDKFNVLLEKLKYSSKFKSVTKEREDQLKNWEKLMDEESELVLYSIALDSVPEEITTEQMVVISELITEDEEKK